MNLKLALAIGLIIAVAGAFFFYSKWIYGVGYDKRTSEYQEAINKAKDTAAKNIKETKKEAQIVYKYIREQDDNCDIYSNVIDRLPNPRSSK